MTSPVKKMSYTVGHTHANVYHLRWISETELLWSLHYLMHLACKSQWVCSSESMHFGLVAIPIWPCKHPQKIFCGRKNSVLAKSGCLGVMLLREEQELYRVKKMSKTAKWNPFFFFLTCLVGKMAELFGWYKKEIETDVLVLGNLHALWECLILHIKVFFNQLKDLI